MAELRSNRPPMYVASLAAATSVALSITLGAAFVHGRLDGRWGATAEVQQAAELLMQMPDQSFGSWHFEDSHELDAPVQELLECSGYTYRTYVNRSTGDIVKVAVILGPPGPIAVHTPEICYSSQQFKQTSKRQRVDFLDRHSLWAVSFRSNSLDAESFVVFYGWSDGSNWQASHDPRWQFAGRPYLYKLQLAGRSSGPDAEASRNACRQFLEEFLPVLKTRLLPRGSQQANR
jgi:hypothetical protein